MSKFLFIISDHLYQGPVQRVHGIAGTEEDAKPASYPIL